MCCGFVFFCLLLSFLSSSPLFSSFLLFFLSLCSCVVLCARDCSCTLSRPPPTGAADAFCGNGFALCSSSNDACALLEVRSVMCEFASVVECPGY